MISSRWFTLPVISLYGLAISQGESQKHAGNMKKKHVWTRIYTLSSSGFSILKTGQVIG